MKKLVTSLSMLIGMVLLAGAADIKPLMIGDKVPAVAVENSKGEKIDLLEESAKQPTILIFYRGGWCPYCMRHLADMNKADAKLKELGFKIFAISPDRVEKAMESDDKGDFSYDLLSDSNVELAKAFGLTFTVDDETIKKYETYGIDLEDASGETHHMLPVPAVFIVGTDGVIDFSYVNPDYKTRLEADVLLAAAKAAVKK